MGKTWNGGVARGICIAAAVILMSGGVVHVDAATLAWNLPNAGSWFSESPIYWFDVGTQFPSGHVPRNGDEVYIGNGGTAEIDAAGLQATCASFSVGAQPVLEGGMLKIMPGSGCVRIINGGRLYLPGDATQISVGRLGFGDLQQEDGTVGGSAIGVGGSYGGHGTYTLSAEGSSRINVGRLRLGEHGTGVFTHSNGQVFLNYSCDVGTGIGWGMYDLSGSSATLEAQHRVTLGGGGSARMTQTAGTCAARQGDDGIALAIAHNRGYASYLQSGGTCVAGYIGGGTSQGLHVGYGDAPYRTDSGNRIYEFYNRLDRPGAMGPRGYYHLGGAGYLWIAGNGSSSIPALVVGSGSPVTGTWNGESWDEYGGVGFLYLGDADWTGWIQSRNAAPDFSNSMMVRWHEPSFGAVRGWTPAPDATHGMRMMGDLYNNGRMIADGYGNDAPGGRSGDDSHILDLSSFSGVRNTIENPAPAKSYYKAQWYANPTADNGWFAQNRGALKLPKVAVTPENPVCNWGEDPSDTTIDLINSVQASLTSIPGSGANRIFQASLLSTDREGTCNGASLLDQGWMPIGMWDMTLGSDLPETAVASLQFRYDDTQVSPAGESNLKLLQADLSAGTWNSPQATVLSDGTHRISTSSVSACQNKNTRFAVASPGWNWTQSGTTPEAWAAAGPWAHDPELELGDYPADLAHPAWLDNGGHVQLGSGTVAAETLYLGCTNRGDWNWLEMTGGTLNLCWLRLGAVNQSAKGKCTISNGTINASSYAFVGENGKGTVEQSGGNVVVGKALHLGLYPNASGTYTLTGGTLNAPVICLGNEGAGELHIRSTTGSEPVQEVKELTIRSNVDAAGTLEGWGRIKTVTDGPSQAPSVFVNNGRVIADGDNQGRVLDLTRFTTIRNNIDNVPPNGSTNNGWFAQHKGELALPPATLKRWYDKDYKLWTSANWGDSPFSESAMGYTETYTAGTSYTIDLVNSLQATFKHSGDLPSNATMTGALLATDHADLTNRPFSGDTQWVDRTVDESVDVVDRTVEGTVATPQSGVPYWVAVVHPTLGEVPVPLAVWRISFSGVVFAGDLNLKIRYDDRFQYNDVELTDEQEAGLQVWVYAGLIGDINHDGYVNVGDLQALVAAWGSRRNPPSSNWNPDADLNYDGYINVGDLQILVSHWGESLDGSSQAMSLEDEMLAMALLDDLGEMSLMDAGGSINLELVAVDPVTSQEVSTVTAPASTQLVVRLYGQGTTSGLLGVGGNIVASGQTGALDSTGRQFTWTPTSQQGGLPGENGGMTELGWGQNLDFSQWNAYFGRSTYVLLGTYTVTVLDAAKPVTLTWEECPLDEWGFRGGYDGWYTTGVAYGDTQIGQITPLLINTLTVTPGPVPEFVYEGWTVNLTAGGWSGYGDALTYTWTQTGGREVLNLTSDPNTGNASFTVPTVQLTTDVPLTFTVTVTDAHDNSVTSQEVTINTYIKGDITQDAFVNVGDTQALVAVWGSGPGYTGPADLNRDGWVNVGDLQTLNANWGRSLGAVAVNFTSAPAYVYEGRSASVICSVCSIHGEPPTYAWTQTGGWNVVNPTGADTASYSFTVPTLLCTNDAPLVFQVAVTAGQDGTATRSVTIPAYMLGDINHNGVVANSGPGNNNDYAAMQAALGSHPGDPNWNAAADFDGDSDVDSADLNLVPSWDRTLAPPVTITSATASPSFAYEGQQVSLACSASNPHGLPLVYEWCWDSGAYVEPTNPLTANASFTVPTLTYTYDTPIVFLVWADDGSSYWAYEYVTANVYLMGDVDHDNDVDSTDAAAVTAAMGTHPGETGWNAAADLNNDQAITAADQALVTSNLGRSLEEYQYGMMAVPEEAGMMAGTMDSSTPAATGPVDSNGLTFEQALQSVGLLEEWLAYLASQQGQ